MSSPLPALVLSDALARVDAARTPVQHMDIPHEPPATRPVLPLPVAPAAWLTGPAPRTATLPLSPPPSAPLPRMEASTSPAPRTAALPLPPPPSAPLPRMEACTSPALRTATLPLPPPPSAPLPRIEACTSPAPRTATLPLSPPPSAPLPRMEACTSPALQTATLPLPPDRITPDVLLDVIDRLMSAITIDWVPHAVALEPLLYDDPMVQRLVRRGQRRMKRQANACRSRLAA